MDLQEDEQRGVVIIDGKSVLGFIDDQECPKCKRDRIYSEDWDAYFCISCDEWLENQCSDPKCEYCSKRPLKPSALLESRIADHG